MIPKTLFSFVRKFNELMTSAFNLPDKPVTFFVIDPRDSQKIIKMEYQQAMVDEEGTVIQLRIIP